MKEATHILIKLPSKGQEDLYRADGMLVASRTKEICRFGNDIGTAQSRLFLTEEKCALFLRRMADVDIRAAVQGEALHQHVYNYANLPHLSVIEERDGESVLTLPGQHLQAGVH